MIYLNRESGFTLLELLIVVTIIGILVSIASAVMLNATLKAKNAAVKANLSVAASVVTVAVASEDQPIAQVVTSTVSVLNDPDQVAGNGDEAKSPHDNTLSAYIEGNSAGKGQVSLNSSNTTQVVIKAYGANNDLLLQKTITKPY